MTNMMSPPCHTEHLGQAQTPKLSFKACHQTLDTIELLEEILSHLPMKDLLFAQKISHTWQNCITSSTRLQQGLFFRAPGNRSTVDLIKQMYEAMIQKDIKAMESCKEKFVESAVVNPLFRKAFSPSQMAIRLLGLNQVFYGGSAFARPEASWRRMLWTYPELKKSGSASTEQKALRIADAFGTSFPFHTTFGPRRAWKSEVVENLQRQLTTLFFVVEEPKSTADLEARVSAVNEF